MKKYFMILMIFCVATIGANAQYWYGRPGIRMRAHPAQPHMRQKPAIRKKPVFQPTLNLSFAYGFPNLDQNELVEFYDEYKGSVTQKGPFIGSIDYQFSPNMSIGVMGTYGKVTTPYYNYNSAGNVPDFTGSLENWSIMFNVMSYMPSYNRQVEPYLRTAIGINNWKQSYLDPSGNKAADLSNPTQLAYQASLGARINLSKGAGFYLEGGYGKYIVSGGLTLKF
jgi:hypothetical protein